MACDFHARSLDWRDQRAPAGPCWEVDLGDGLDEQDTTELHQLYACLDQSGNLAPLSELDQALDAETRWAMPVGHELAWLVNNLGRLDLDPWGLAGALADLLDDDDDTLDIGVELGVELLYGRSYGEIAQGVELKAGSELDRGLVRPALPLAQQAASLLLDDDNGIPELVADALTAPATADLLCSLGGIARTTDAQLLTLGKGLVGHLGAAVEAARSPDNDHWSEATGDSLRDLAMALLIDTAGDGQTPLEAMGDNLGQALGDVTLMHRLRQVFTEAEAGGHLDPLPLQLLYLAEVDSEGEPVAPGGESALYALLRLLARANEPLDCSLDLWVTDLEVHLDNLSVALLVALAERDPEDVASGVSLLGTVLGWSFSRSTLEAVADSGVCPLVDRQMVADLDALDRFNDAEAGDLLVVFLDILDAFHDPGGTDRIPELVDLLDTAWSRGLVPPLEEVLRDLADSAAAQDLMDLLAVLLAPDALDTAACPTGAAPLDFAAVWSFGYTLLVEDAHGRQPLEVLDPLLALVLNHEATWTLAGNAAAWLQDDRTHAHDLTELAARAVEADPDLAWSGDLSELLVDREFTDPVLAVAETTEVVDALARAELSREGPLPWLARLVVGGTLDVFLRTLDLALDWLDGLVP